MFKSTRNFTVVGGPSSIDGRNRGTGIHKGFQCVVRSNGANSMSSPHVQKCSEFYGRGRTSEYRRAKQRHDHSGRGIKRCTYHLVVSPYWSENLGSPHAQKRLKFYGRRRTFKCRWVKQRHACGQTTRVRRLTYKSC